MAQALEARLETVELVRADGIDEAPAADGGVVAVGPTAVEVTPVTGGEQTGDETMVEWSVANRGDRPISLRAVRLVWSLHGVSDPLRVFRNGYQSWSRTGVATFGVDEDPSRTEGSLDLVRGIHHADQSVAAAGELRSELVTVLVGEGEVLLVGFDGGRAHDGTLRVRPGARGPELVTEAFLGGASVGSGERRLLHGIVLRTGDDASRLLADWAGWAGGRGGARADGAYQVGWCSWYQYFHEVTERDVQANLARAGDWPFTVFQVDDGYQADIGDWLDTNDRFSSDLSRLAATITDRDLQAGIWLAPFLVGPDSEVARRHPEWLARDAGGEPLLSMWNPGWGGSVFGLDTTRADVSEHLEATAAALVDAGFDYLKLDFTFSPSLEGRWADGSMTPAERVRAGFDAVRRGAGAGAFLLGCGAPLGPSIGVVDGMRIGPDVAPAWEVEHELLPGYVDTQPATVNAWRNTLGRSFTHRRLWLNDPDCLMLRNSETRMSDKAVRAWARAVAVSGGMALVSDDLSLLGPEERGLLEEVIEVGRESDDAARWGEPPRCEDLMDEPLPGRLSTARVVLEADPTEPASALSPR